MIFIEAIEYIEQLNAKFGITPGLDTISEFLERLGNPHDDLKVIHVAGTNGKGSVSTFIAYILSEAGYKVGRYISPAVNGYCEKIQYINNSEVTYISENHVIRYIEYLKSVADEMYNESGMHPSSFELETAMSFIAFKDWECDYVVVECGMGGMEDATNVIDNKELCVFTHIALDHTTFLGDTVEKIAENKAGILRDGVKAVSSEQIESVSMVLKTIADKMNVDITICDNCRIEKSDIDGSTFVYDNKTWNIAMTGMYQARNAVTAIEAVRKLDIGISDDEISDGLLNATWPGRFEIIRRKPYVVIDGAHNPDGVKELVSSLNAMFNRDKYKRIAVMGVFADKAVDEMLELLKNEFDEFHTVTAPTGRGMNAKELAKRVKTICNIDVLVHEMPDNKTINNIINMDTTEDSVIVVFGSLSLQALIKGSNDL